MNSKLLSAALAIFILFSTSNAHAGLIAGEVYFDSAGERWEYVTNFDMSTGPYWDDVDGDAVAHGALANPMNGLEVAVYLLNGNMNDYAISAFENTFNLDAIQAKDVVVNHKAWYDQYQNAYVKASEGAVANVGAAGYSEAGDKSAWILDRAEFNDTKINYIFKKATIPEPTTLAIFALALLGLSARRLTK